MMSNLVEVVAALIWDNDKFMICQRPANKARALLWEFVGGKVEPGETKEQALVRECQEELSITLSVGDKFMEVVHEYPDIKVNLTLFNATIAKGIPQKLEHNDIKWITPQETSNYEFCPADEGFLQKLKFNLAEEKMDILSLGEMESYQNSLNALSPYVGKMRPNLARYLIKKYSNDGDTIYDPFAGSGTVLLGGWVLGHTVIGHDLNYYAYILTLGKLNPIEDFKDAERKLIKYKRLAEKKAKTYKIDDIPEWVKSFYDHETLKEICCWIYYLKQKKEWFLLSCLLGILHHQRPGFLSYPSSHGAPYLRTSKYPETLYPEMYQYKNVYEKLYRKVKRSYSHIPHLDYTVPRKVMLKDATKVSMNNQHYSTIITSPPYMKSLTYARDNRLRLWFLGVCDWIELDKRISPEKNMFINTMKKCFKKWAKVQHTGDKCIIVIGDIFVKYGKGRVSLSDVMIDLSKRYYKCLEIYQDPIPQIKKVVKGNTNIKREIIIVLERI